MHNSNKLNSKIFSCFFCPNSTVAHSTFLKKKMRRLRACKRKRFNLISFTFFCCHPLTKKGEKKGNKEKEKRKEKETITYCVSVLKIFKIIIIICSLFAHNHILQLNLSEILITIMTLGHFRFPTRSVA